MPAYEIIRDAILTKKQVTAIYHGHYREMCPHAIGQKNGRAQALFYQFGGQSSSGLAPPGSPTNWRCIVIDELQDVKSRPGAWHTGDNHSRAQTCVGEIDVEVKH